MDRIKIKIKTSKYTRKIYFLLKFLYMFFYNLRLYIFGKIFSLFPIDNKKIVVSNYNGKGYGDNPKYIIDFIINNHKNKYKIVWLVNEIKDLDFPSDVIKIKNESLRAIYELSTAKIWIDNTTKRFSPPKRKKQFYIQTWHAGIGMKKVGIETKNVDKAYLKSVKKDNRKIDAFISNCKYRTEIYRNSFMYTGKIIEQGIPRNDFLVNNSYDIKKIKSNLKLDDEKIILYAPTYRKDSIVETYSLDLERMKRVFENKFGTKCVVLVKLHPYISSFSYNFDNKNILNVSKYSDIMELLAISDVVISDYSSLIFDYSITRKPVYLFVPDLDDYIKKEGLNFKMEELPFIYAKTNDELEEAIINFDNKLYNRRIDAFFELVGLNETGKSCEIISKLIEKWGVDNEKL